MYLNRCLCTGTEPAKAFDPAAFDPSSGEPVPLDFLSVMFDLGMHDNSRLSQLSLWLIAQQMVRQTRTVREADIVGQ